MSSQHECLRGRARGEHYQALRVKTLEQLDIICDDINEANIPGWQIDSATIPGREFMEGIPKPVLTLTKQPAFNNLNVAGAPRARVPAAAPRATDRACLWQESPSRLPTS